MNCKYYSLVTRVQFLTCNLQINNTEFPLAKMVFVWIYQTFKAKPAIALIDPYIMLPSLMKNNSIFTSISPIGYPTKSWIRNSTAQACSVLIQMQICLIFHKRMSKVLFNLGKEQYYDFEKKLQSNMQVKHSVNVPKLSARVKYATSMTRICPVSSQKLLCVSRDSCHQFIWIP